MESEDCYAVGGARALLNCPLPPELEVGFKCRIIRPEVEVIASDVSKMTISQVQPGEYRHRVLDSEDSSYDSDYDFPRSTSGASSVHDNVSRTTSETLDGELKNESDSDSESSDSESFTNPEDFNYLNYSFKLGFTEEQARVVLKKIGPNPPRDQFLNGLLQLGNSGSSQPVTAKHEEAPEPMIVDPTPVLRYIVIDGSNVAMTHGNKEKFSCKGIQLCVQWFLARGHKNITVFVPAWRKEASTVEAPISDRKILLELEKEKLLVFTPSRQSPDGRRIICYDDRYILQTAKDNDAIVVSNDNYRDLAAECPEYRPIIEKRILMYSFVNDRFMPPDDPLGRSGPKLEQFLRKTPAQPCPYNGRCTYGNKCKYFHPERGNVPQKSIVEQLAENAQKKQREAVSKKKVTRDTLTRSLNPETGKKSLQRTYSTTPVVSLPRGVTEDRPVRGSSPNPSNFNSISPHKFTVPPPPISSEEGVNPHRKVTRELSLLPDDQRITSLRHGGLAPPFPPPQISPHPPVFRHQSAPFALPTTNQARSPLRNVESAEKILPLDLRVPPPVVTHPWAGRTSSLPPYNFALPAVEKKRQEIALHLKAILPGELVEEAMSMMPEETDAVKICAAISQLAIGQKPTNRI